jgi:hypothetical protein
MVRLCLSNESLGRIASRAGAEGGATVVLWTRSIGAELAQLLPYGLEERVPALPRPYCVIGIGSGLDFVVARLSLVRRLVGFRHYAMSSWMRIFRDVIMDEEFVASTLNDEVAMHANEFRLSSSPRLVARQAFDHASSGNITGSKHEAKLVLSAGSLSNILTSLKYFHSLSAVKRCVLEADPSILGISIKGAPNATGLPLLNGSNVSGTTMFIGLCHAVVVEAL